VSAKVYRVCGSRRYRGHDPGEEFSALIEPGIEGRLVARGVIEVIDGLRPMLTRDSFVLPNGWEPINGAGRRLSTIDRGR
jgi:hypothetical protein